MVVTSKKMKNGFEKSNSVRKSSITSAMFDTFIPGFCFHKNGQYRNPPLQPSHIQQSSNNCNNAELIEELLYTEHQLDIQKLLCLHLLSTHVRRRKTIGDNSKTVFCRKKGSVLQRTSLDYLRSGQEALPDLLPRYIINMKEPARAASCISSRTYDSSYSSTTDEDFHKRKVLVPVFINNDVNTIVNTVIDALKQANSDKIETIYQTSQDPDKLKELLYSPVIVEYITSLVGHPLLTRATSYDYYVLVAKKEPPHHTEDVIAQVLEVDYDPYLQTLLRQIRYSLSRRHHEHQYGRQSIKEHFSSFVWPRSPSTLSTSIKDSLVTQKQQQKTNIGAPKQAVVAMYAQTEVINPFEQMLQAQRRLSTDVRKIEKDVAKSIETVASPQRGTISVKRATCQACLNNWKQQIHMRLFRMEKKHLRNLHFTLDEPLRTSILMKNGIPQLPHLSKSNWSKLERDIQRNKEELGLELNEDNGRQQSEATPAAVMNVNQTDDLIKSKINFLNNSQRIILAFTIGKLKSNSKNLHQFPNKKNINMTAILEPILRNSTDFDDETEGKFIKEPENMPRPSDEFQGPNPTAVLPFVDRLTGPDMDRLRQDIAGRETMKRVKDFLMSPI